VHYQQLMALQIVLARAYEKVIEKSGITPSNIPQDVRLEPFQFVPHHEYQRDSQSGETLGFASTDWIIPIGLALGFTFTILTYVGQPVSDKETGFKVVQSNKVYMKLF
jgi:hypothetical protein